MKCQFEAFERVMVRTSDNLWVADMFSNIDPANPDQAMMVSGKIVKLDNIIEYNVGTAKLLGTTDNNNILKFKYGDHVEVRDVDDDPFIAGIFVKYGDCGVEYPYMVATKKGCDWFKQCRSAN